ncbi:DMT family transporter [Salinispora tropica]|uniref:EamA domain-containing protein n=1 Tax=Salinispora tropica (strain ATCC BAA-916 / DSM 44818 / JCM 13857 / NBRC 105044 / CNB-440) TaxID=369723 RepID=A4X2L6_SALTO|nr:DMT family transporter [Salinispora tropica]ABP53116.1 protein of unknown function DUF6, transmembrane [Salinispora tropica CNB-440]
MRVENSAITEIRIPPLSSGTLFASLGVLSFSFSLPATLWVLDGFGPWSATGVRGVLAAAVALTALIVARVPLPTRGDWHALTVVAVGCVIGFPLLTTLALQTSTTAHSAVVVGAMPLATAAISALRTGRRPSLMFWTAASIGAATVMAFTISQNHGQPTIADLYLLGGLVVCAAGYVEGGRLSVRMPGWQVIAWGVVLAGPVSLAVCVVALPHEPVRLTVEALVGMAYIAGVSQFGGFVLWYGGMGLIGVTRASQLQLAQPMLTLLWASLILGEPLNVAMPLTAAVALGCIVVTQRARMA